MGASMAEKQLSLFDAPRNVTPIDTHLVKEEKPRLTGQNMRILERLQHGAATNRELVEYGLNYRARISDLRAAGYNVQVVSRDHRTGLTMYEIVKT